MSLQSYVWRLLAGVVFLHSGVCQSQDIGNDLAWLVPAATAQPRLQKEPRLLGGSMPAGESEQRLIEAARAGQVKEVKEQLALGARANAQDVEGRRALHAAVANGHWEVARLLLKAGADPNAGNQLSRSALDLAVIHGQDRMIDILIRNGADLERRNGIGNTPLITALLLERETAARELIKLGARLDARSGDKRCIGELAAMHASEELMNMVLEQGGNVACQ